MTISEAVKWLENLFNEIGKTANYHLWNFAQALEKIIKMLKDQSQIVRCGECRKRFAGECKFYMSMIETKDDFFCADGEPKDGEHK